MSILLEQVERIQNLAPGWEADFNQLVEDIRERLINEIPTGDYLRRAGLSPDPERGDFLDFISFMYELYHKKASNRTLFANYDPGLCSRPEVYLTQWDFVRYKVLLFKAGVTPEFAAVDPEDAEEFGAMVILPPPHGQFTAGTGIARSVYTQARERVGQALSALTKEQLGCFAQYAALQMFPHLDPTQPGTRALREHLESLAPRDQLPGLAWLAMRHEMCRKEVWMQIKRILSDLKIENLGDRRRDVLIGRLCARIVRLVFCPLDAATVMDILGVTRPNADQIHRRYRRWLREILEGDS